MARVLQCAGAPHWKCLNYVWTALKIYLLFFRRSWWPIWSSGLNYQPTKRCVTLFLVRRICHFYVKVFATKSKLGVKSEAEHLIHIFLACHKVWHQSCLFFIFSHYPCISQSNVTFVLMQTRVHRFIFAWILLPDVKTSHATRQSLMGWKLKWIWINIFYTFYNTIKKNFNKEKSM